MLTSCTDPAVLVGGGTLPIAPTGNGRPRRCPPNTSRLVVLLPCQFLAQDSSRDSLRNGDDHGKVQHRLPLHRTRPAQ